MRYTQKHNQIVEVCKTSLTYTEVEARLGTTTPNTGLRRYIKQNNIPMPMFEGQLAARQTTKHTITKKDLCRNSKVNTCNIKRFLFRNKLKEEKCEKCNWCEKRKSDGKVPIHLHHKNGDSSDNRLENLEILCPNCHSLTENYAGKNKHSDKRRKIAKERNLYYSAPKQICENCGKLGYGEKYCSVKCAGEGIKRVRKVAWPSKEVLFEELKTMSWVALGRKYGVSDNAIRKWARHYKLLK